MLFKYLLCVQLLGGVTSFTGLNFKSFEAGSMGRGVGVGIDDGTEKLTISRKFYHDKSLDLPLNHYKFPDSKNFKITDAFQDQSIMFWDDALTSDECAKYQP